MTSKEATPHQQTPPTRTRLIPPRRAFSIPGTMAATNVGRGGIHAFHTHSTIMPVRIVVGFKRPGA